jgi:hypothetical protein
MSLDAVQIKMDKGQYKRPRDFAQDMNLVPCPLETVSSYSTYSAEL